MARFSGPAGQGASRTLRAVRRAEAETRQAAYDALGARRDSRRIKPGTAEYAEPADVCRPVTVEVDGEPVTVRVRGEQPMSEESRAAFAEIIAAAKRKFDSEPRPADLCPKCGFRIGKSIHRRRCGDAT